METIRVPLASGATLAADIAGPAGAATVILGHGGGQTRHSWAQALRELVAAGYRVINYDLLGHGESDWCPDQRYGILHRAEHLDAVAALATRPFALVGASLGGITALAATTAGLEPAAIVLVDIVLRIEPAGVARIHAFMTAHPEGFASLDEAAAAVAAYNPDRPRPADPSGLARNLRLGADGRYRWHWDPAMLADLRSDPAGLAALLDGAAWTGHVPTLLVRGLKSDIVSDAGVADLRRQIPALEVIDVGDAGHMVAGDRNDAFNAAMIGFLKRAMPPLWGPDLPAVSQTATSATARPVRSCPPRPPG